MYMSEGIVDDLLGNELVGWSMKRKRILHVLTVNISGLDTVEDLQSVVDVIERVPEDKLRSISLDEMREMGYRW